MISLDQINKTMSEQSSLYARIKIKKENFEPFLKSELSVTQNQSGWQEWWNKLDPYGDVPLKGNLHTYTSENIRSFIKTWISLADTYSFSDYDIDTETWHFGIIMFTENYLEMIPGIAAIRGVLPFKEFDESDFIIVFPFLWESHNHCDAYLKFTATESVFLQETDEADIKRARKYLDKKFRDIIKMA